MADPGRFDRVILIVMDSAGIGEMPDAADYGDEGSDTLGNVLRSRRVHLPNFANLGLGNIRPLASLAPAESPSAAHGPTSADACRGGSSST